MPEVTISAARLADAEEFLQAVDRSAELHADWVEPPTVDAFERY